jgi:putative GTP pyrophosphokinase
MIPLRKVMQRINSEAHLFDLFRKTVEGFFSGNESLNSSDSPVIHSIKTRIKSVHSIEKKIKRKGYKFESEKEIFEKLTDLVGVRVIHYAPRQILDIDHALNIQIKKNEWKFCERPKAYTWDPELKHLYESLGYAVEIKDSFYTSVHFLVSPATNTPIKCEIQVRNIFEEAWGELDHILNYPDACTNPTKIENLKVMARIVSAGSRIADTIIHSTKPAPISAPKVKKSSQNKAAS